MLILILILIQILILILIRILILILILYSTLSYYILGRLLELMSVTSALTRRSVQSLTKSSRDIVHFHLEHRWFLNAPLT